MSQIDDAGLRYERELKATSLLAVEYGFDEIETQQFITDWCNRHARVEVTVLSVSDVSGQKWHLRTRSIYIDAPEHWTAGYAAPLLAAYGVLRAFGKASLIAAAGILSIGFAIAILRDALGI